MKIEAEVIVLMVISVALFGLPFWARIFGTKSSPSSGQPDAQQIGNKPGGPQGSGEPGNPRF